MKLLAGREKPSCTASDDQQPTTHLVTNNRLASILGGLEATRNRLLSLRKQAFSLAFAHGTEIVQPLLVFLYAGRVFTPVSFGQFAYAMAISQIATTAVDYGFFWTAQRAAASSHREPAMIASLFADVVTTKAALFIIVAVAGYAASGSLLAMSKPMFLACMLTSLGNIIFASWLFIALERAWQFAIGMVLGRAVALAAFVTFVRSPADVLIAVAIQASIPLIAGILTVPFIIPIGLQGFRKVTPGRVVAQLRSGWRGFLYTLVDRAVASLPVPFVEHFGGFIAAGQYSIAEKFIAAVRPFFSLMLNTFQPRVAHYSRVDPAAGFALISSALVTLIVGVALSLSLFLVAPYLIILLFGESFAGAVPIVRTMAVLPILININVCTSSLYMFNYGHERAWAHLTVIGMLVFIASAYVLCLTLTNAGVAVTLGVIARECTVLSVSASFFIAFGIRNTKVARNRGARATWPNTGGAEPALVSPTGATESDSRP